MKQTNLPLIRRQLDRKLYQLIDICKILKRPKDGWIRIVREVLSMSTTQLAGRLGVSQPAVSKLEKNEKSGNITLKNMNNIADKLECDFVYFLIPKNDSFKMTYEKKVLEYAKKITARVSYSMSLEEQKINKVEEDAQIQEIYKELLSKNTTKIWDE